MPNAIESSVGALFPLPGAVSNYRLLRMLYPSQRLQQFVRQVWTSCHFRSFEGLCFWLKWYLSNSKIWRGCWGSVRCSGKPSATLNAITAGEAVMDQHSLHFPYILSPFSALHPLGKHNTSWVCIKHMTVGICIKPPVWLSHWRLDKLQLHS